MVWYFIGVYIINRIFTWSLGDTKFLFSCWKKYFTSDTRRNFVSLRGHVISCMYQWWSSSHVKITCYLHVKTWCFHMKAYLVFHRCFYNNEQHLCSQFILGVRFISHTNFYDQNFWPTFQGWPLLINVPSVTFNHMHHPLYDRMRGLK